LYLDRNLPGTTLDITLLMSNHGISVPSGLQNEKLDPELGELLLHLLLVSLSLLNGLKIWEHGPEESTLGLDLALLVDEEGEGFTPLPWRGLRHR
jgi:hypothetical protein